jgi:Sulfatase-modifying factor enzyme 1
MIEHLESEPVARAAVDRFAREARERRAWQFGRTPAFKDLGDARMRRQIIRWLGREYHEPTPAIVETLRSALQDADWEVRASALVVSARLRAKPLRSVVRETPLPSTQPYGLSERDVRLLVASRIIVAESLAAADPDDMDRAQVILRQLSDAPRHLVRSVLGLSVEQRDAAWLLLHSLATPMELAEPMPDPLPAGLTLHDGRAWLSGIVELSCVSAQTHLVGGDHLQHEHPGTTPAVREFTPANGFFIARRPLSAPMALQLGHGPFASRTPSDVTLATRLAETPDPPLLLTHDEALALCESISARTGVSVTLPTADELESAARGTDGRRFPWGNGLEKVDGRVRSPHGIERFSSPIAQWTDTRDASEVPLVLGGPHSPHCAGRSPSIGHNAVRPVVRVGR